MVRRRGLDLETKELRTTGTSLHTAVGRQTEIRDHAHLFPQNQTQSTFIERLKDQPFPPAELRAWQIPGDGLLEETRQFMCQFQEKRNQRVRSANSSAFQEPEISCQFVCQLLQEETRQVKDQLSAQMQQLQEEVKNQLLGLSQQVTQALQVPVATSGRGLETRGDLDTRVDVWCDMDEEGADDGGWTVVLLRRPLDTQVNFDRGWRDYSNGFGSPDTEYWIGNEALHALTNGATQVLRVDMTDWDRESRYAQYSSFHVADRDHDYRLRVGTVSGTAGDALRKHDNMLFSTPDRDNDIHDSSNCADYFNSGLV
ncbi:LOW QUALITY PROTEIN: fibrinogen-like protein 1 [Macrobrachium rosenbergii]|uniref:LOW QUALITY PROTEIN: fibrinogen-like protein 1 n=1 Tax=Macrobrachium rosenbergii TaxID=79674 RepID=UPI0034D53FB8